MNNSRESHHLKLGANHSPTAFTLIELLVVVAFVAIILALCVSSMGPRPAYGIHCMSNLKQVGLAFRIYAGENADRIPMQLLTNRLGKPLYITSADEFRYFQYLSNELTTPQVLFCGADKKRRAATNFTSDFNSEHISYFLGLDGRTRSLNHEETAPVMARDSCAFLAGDANLTNDIPPKNGLMEVTSANSVNWTEERHRIFGNILFCDGSVSRLDRTNLLIAVQKTGFATNRLLLPP